MVQNSTLSEQDNIFRRPISLKGWIYSNAGIRKPNARRPRKFESGLISGFQITLMHMLNAHESHTKDASVNRLFGRHALMNDLFAY